MGKIGPLELDTNQDKDLGFQIAEKLGKKVIDLIKWGNVELVVSITSENNVTLEEIRAMMKQKSENIYCRKCGKKTVKEKKNVIAPA